MHSEAESSVRFGVDGSLFGILTRSSSAGHPRPGVIILNAGVIHRVGPHRMNVLLARSLAAAGFTTLRFDLGGLGDSKAQPSDRPFQERAVSDVRAAMDWLARTEHLQQFVLFGLCSGADNSLATALVDPRVVGLVLVDPHTWVTPRAQARKLAAKVQTLGSVRRVAEWGATYGMRRLRAKLDELRAPAANEEADQGRTAPAPEVFRQWIEQLLDRGASLLAIYSGALGERYNHEDQLFELFPDLRGRMDRAYFPEANHTFTPRASQARLVTTTTDWLSRRFV